MFEFIDKNDLNYRSEFANRVCKLLYDKYGDIDKAINSNEAKELFNDFEENIRNIYELVDIEIPLYAYYNLMKYGKDNWGFNDTEYHIALYDCIKACELYYNS